MRGHPGDGKSTMVMVDTSRNISVAEMDEFISEANACAAAFTEIESLTPPDFKVGDTVMLRNSDRWSQRDQMEFGKEYEVLFVGDFSLRVDSREGGMSGFLISKEQFVKVESPSIKFVDETPEECRDTELEDAARKMKEDAHHVNRPKVVWPEEHMEETSYVDLFDRLEAGEVPYGSLRCNIASFEFKYLGDFPNRDYDDLLCAIADEIDPDNDYDDNYYHYLKQLKIAVKHCIENLEYWGAEPKPEPVEFKIGDKVLLTGQDDLTKMDALTVGDIYEVDILFPDDDQIGLVGQVHVQTVSLFKLVTAEPVSLPKVQWGDLQYNPGNKFHGIIKMAEKGYLPPEVDTYVKYETERIHGSNLDHTYRHEMWKHALGRVNDPNLAKSTHVFYRHIMAVIDHYNANPEAWKG